MWAVGRPWLARWLDLEPREHGPRSRCSGGVRPWPDRGEHWLRSALIDTVETRDRRPAGLATEAAAARRDGFVAKAVIHPKHVEAVNAAFAPTAAEIAWAEQVVRAFARDSAAGVVRIDGRMIDKPHLRAAEAILATAPKGAA